MSRLTNCGLDGHDSFVDLGDLELKELHEHPRMGARQHDLRAASIAGHFENVGLDAIALAIALQMHLFSRGDDPFSLADIDNQGALLKTPHDPRDQLSDPITVRVVDLLSLRVTNSLNDDLLGRLRRNPAQGLHVHLETEFVTHHGAWVQLSSLFDLNLRVIVVDLFDYRLELEQFDFVRARIVLSLDVLGLAVHLPGCRDHRLLDSLAQRLGGDVLLLTDLLDDSVETFHAFLLAVCSTALLAGTPALLLSFGLGHIHQVGPLHRRNGDAVVLALIEPNGDDVSIQLGEGARPVPSVLDRLPGLHLDALSQLSLIVLRSLEGPLEAG